MDPLLVFPDPPPAEIARALEVTGHAWKAVDSGAAERHDRPEAGWRAAVLVVDSTVDEVVTIAESLRSQSHDTPILIVLAEDHLAELVDHADCYDDFCAQPVRADELSIRLDRLIRPTDQSDDDREQLVVYGPLMINPATYQAMIDGKPLDLTYMEYELLKHFAQHPGRVCTREVLLSQVWGYDYYGGARTVDVHVRRLRAKLGEPHAALISTVRSVGYRFGRSQWG